ncbi:MAG: COR domain-containing protein [Chthoniobacterales bacterium]
MAKKKSNQTPEDIARQRIAEARASGDTTLDLSGLGLTTLPAEIGQLTALTELNLYRNKLTTLPAEIGKLSALIDLDVSSNFLVTLPAEIGDLTALSAFALFDNKLTKLPAEFTQLSVLKYLNLANNQLTDLLAEISRLSSLVLFILHDNQLTKLPDSLTDLASSHALTGLYLHTNPALGLPVEILGPTWLQVYTPDNRKLPEEQQIKPQAPVRIARYLRQLQAGSSYPLSEAKILVVGPGGHGKSSLIEYLRDGTFQKGKKTTEGIKVAPWMVPQDNGDGDLRLNVWDFGGQEIQHSTHEFFLSQRAVYVLVFQPRDDQAAAQGLYYWIDLIHLIAPNAPVIVALSKQDEYEGTVNDAGDLKKLHTKIIDFIPVSCDQTHPASKNMNRLRQAVLDAVRSELGHIHYKLPASWMAVKDGLEQPGIDFLGYGDYQQRCLAAGIADAEDQQLLAIFLNDLGTMLNYADRMPLENTHILNPKWVTEGVYAVVLAKELATNEGVFDDALLGKLLSDAKLQNHYPPEAQKFIKEMMLTFKLCYQLTQGGKSRRYLVPNALPAAAPEGVGEGMDDSLQFEIRFPRILPSSVISRFIVAMHSHRKTDKRWRLGLRSRIGEHDFLVTAHPKEKRIRIAVAGSGPSRARALEVIRQHFIEICREKEGLGNKEYTFPPGFPNAEAYPFDNLLEAERNEQPSIWLPGGVGNVEVVTWLNGVTDPKARAKIQKAIAELPNAGNPHANITYNIEKVEQMTGADMSKQENKTVTITAHDMTNVAVGIDQQLQDCLKMIQATTNAEMKSALEALHGQVTKLASSPELADKQTVKDDLESFTKEALKPQPRRKLLEVTGDGLVDAAKTVAAMGPLVIESVRQVMALLAP